MKKACKISPIDFRKLIISIIKDSDIYTSQLQILPLNQGSQLYLITMSFFSAGTISFSFNGCACLPKGI